jgi:hypothetical protein
MEAALSPRCVLSCVRLQDFAVQNAAIFNMKGVFQPKFAFETGLSFCNSVMLFLTPVLFTVSVRMWEVDKLLTDFCEVWFFKIKLIDFVQISLKCRNNNGYCTSIRTCVFARVLSAAGHVCVGSNDISNRSCIDKPTFCPVPVFH